MVSHWLHEFHTGLEGRPCQDRQLPSRISHLFAESSKSYKTIQIFSFCLRCKDRWITPTTELTRYSERRIWADRQTSSLFVYLQDEKIHGSQSEFVWNSQDGRMSRTLDWKALPLTLPWIRQMILLGWERRKKNGGRHQLKESAVGNILHNRWRFEKVKQLGKTSCSVSVFGVLCLQLAYINDTTRQKKKIIKNIRSNCRGFQNIINCPFQQRPPASCSIKYFTTYNIHSSGELFPSPPLSPSKV